MQILVNVEYVSKCGRAWWDSYLKNKIFEVKSKKDIKKKLTELLKEEGGLNKKFNFAPIYKDLENGEAVQVGFNTNITTEFIDETCGKWKRYAFEAWVQVLEVNNIKF